MATYNQLIGVLRCHAGNLGSVNPRERKPAEREKESFLHRALTQRRTTSSLLAPYLSSRTSANRK